MSSESESLGVLMSSVWDAYRRNVPHRLKLIDSFLVFVLLTGIIQFCYMLVAGQFPFNSFLAGFFSCVGVFVLTVSLRLQVSEANRKDPLNKWQHLSIRRAYLDWLFCNLILHTAVLNFLG